MRYMRILSLAVLAVVSLSIFGCGGGDGGDETASNDATLSSLTISSGQLDQLFVPAQPDYSAAVGFLKASVAVIATATDVNASIKINNLTVSSGAGSPALELLEGVNAIDVTVTAEDGATTMNYTLTITRAMAASFAQQAYVKASNTDGGDQFGWSVALSGDTLAVGAYVEAGNGVGVNSGAQADDAEAFSGAVYVFTRSGGTWSQQAYIKASNAEGNDLFGYSVALSGDSLAVGAYGEESNGVGVNSATESNNDALESGAVYVFARSGGSWSQQAYIKASNSAASDRFGWRIALSDDTLAVGAWGEDSNGSGVNGGAQANDLAVDSGAVYLFTRSSEAWTQQAYVKASNTASDDFFGFSVALYGDTLAVGAWGEDSNGLGVNSGAGASNLKPGSGAVYVFTRNSGIWAQQAYVKASNTDANDLFGYSVALSGDTLAVGAYLEAGNGVGVNNGAQGDDSLNESGAVYVFARVTGVWSQQAYIKASNTDANDRFGYSLALADDTLAVGAYKEDSNGTDINSGAQGDESSDESGAVYVFTRAGISWSQQSYVKASNTGDADFFGFNLSLSNDSIAVGTPGEAGNGIGVNSATQADDSLPGAGSVYVLQ